MKTLFILSIASGYGGAERSVEIIARHVPADIYVRIFVANSIHLEQLTRPGTLPSNVTVIRVPGGETRTDRRLSALRLVAECLRYRPHALLLNTQASALIAAMAARFVTSLGARCHLYVRDFLWEDIDFIFKRLHGVRVLVPDAVVAERLGYLSPFHLQPFGASPWTVVPDMVEMEDGNVSYGGPILHLATVNPWKGHVELAVALQYLHAQRRPVSLISCGMRTDPALWERLMKLVDRVGLSGSYRFVDYVPDPSPLLRTCCAVVVASVPHSGGPEAFGRAVIEAWAHRKPVVAYAAGAPARLITHEVDGLLVPPGDTRALAEALARIVTSPHLCRRLGEAGHARAAQTYEARLVTLLLLDRLVGGDCP
ncbi:glycosyltransferase family 4 protein [Pseudomonas stutzeri]|uniref:Glycosyl transferase family 1 domain-containing protein n=1 Tax=Stutzerimonas stutzeri TaxID=316 RepID=A0A2N8RXT9_STUST|nr:glycosyltransferase family 4 protein [Stutzerimonas stutzeri]MCQ4296214.1 glycosyltransferase family 4 protein [Stutzerimonas stutzeri]PNF79200.1 hypothetical protein CXK92_16905 [Stutzerimonas stutzeri]